MSRYSLLLIGVVVACSPVSGAGTQDAMAALDDYNVRASIILQCHPSQSAEDRAFLSRGDAVRRAALTQLQSQLDKADPSHRADNARTADMAGLLDGTVGTAGPGARSATSDGWKFESGNHERASRVPPQERCSV